MQSDNILILANNDFANIEENIIKSAKIMVKSRKHFTSIQPLKFNGLQIKPNSNRIVFINKILKEKFF